MSSDQSLEGESLLDESQGKGITFPPPDWFVILCSAAPSYNPIILCLQRCWNHKAQEFDHVGFLSTHQTPSGHCVTSGLDLHDLLYLEKAAEIRCSQFRDAS